MAIWNKDKKENKKEKSICAKEVTSASDQGTKTNMSPLLAGLTKLAWAVFSYVGWFLLWSFICLVCLPYSVTQLVILSGIGTQSPPADLAFILGPPVLLTTVMWIYVFYVCCKRWCLFLREKLCKADNKTE